MSSGVGRPSDNNFEQYAEEALGRGGEEQHVPAQAEEVTTLTGRTAQEQIDARYAASAALDTDEPPAFDDFSGGIQRLDYAPAGGQRNEAYNARQLEAMRRQQRQPSLLTPGPAAPEYSGGAPTAPRPPTSRLRRMASAFTVRSQASTSSLRTQAGASRTSLPDTNLAGEAPPPLPVLPASVRQRQATGDSAAAGPSEPRGPANVEVPDEGLVAKRGVFSKKRTPEEIQDDRNHKLRDSIKSGDTKGITRRLGKGADPTTPSSINRQNAFHKLASAREFTRGTTRELIDASDPVRLGQAAIAKDANGNTPIHIAQHSLGKAVGRNDENMQRRYRDLTDRLTAAATSNGHDVNAITNNDGRTPQQMREAGQQAVEAALEREREFGDNLLRW
jgi:hypothetical protein